MYGEVCVPTKKLVTFYGFSKSNRLYIGIQINDQIYAYYEYNDGQPYLHVLSFAYTPYLVFVVESLYHAGLNMYLLADFLPEGWKKYG